MTVYWMDDSHAHIFRLRYEGRLIDRLVTLGGDRVGPGEKQTEVLGRARPDAPSYWKRPCTQCRAPSGGEPGHWYETNAALLAGHG